MNIAKFNPWVGALLLLMPIAIAVALVAAGNTPQPGTAPVPGAIPRPEATTTPVLATVPVSRATMDAILGYPTPDPAALDEASEADLHRSLYTRPGELIAHGTNTKPTGPLGVKTYRLEEVVLPGPTTFSPRVTGRNITVDRVWRLTVSGGPFTMRAMPLGIYVDGAFAGIGVESIGLHEATVIIYDAGVLHEGATIGVAYYGEEPSTLPEALHIER